MDIVGEFKVDNAKYDKKDWSVTFVSENLGFASYNEPSQPSTRYRSCLDLVLAPKLLSLPSLESNKAPEGVLFLHSLAGDSLS